MVTRRNRSELAGEPTRRSKVERLDADDWRLARIRECARRGLLGKDAIAANEEVARADLFLIAYHLKKSIDGQFTSSADSLEHDRRLLLVIRDYLKVLSVADRLSH